MKTEVYQLQYTTSLEELREQLNRILFKISDRVDRIEGIRGTASIEDTLQITTGDDVLHGFNTDDEI